MLAAELSDPGQGEHHDQVTGHHDEHQEQDHAAVQVTVGGVHGRCRAVGKQRRNLREIK